MVNSPEPGRRVSKVPKTFPVHVSIPIPGHFRAPMAPLSNRR